MAVLDLDLDTFECAKEVGLPALAVSTRRPAAHCCLPNVARATAAGCHASDTFRVALKTIELEHERQMRELRSTLLGEVIQPANSELGGLREAGAAVNSSTSMRKETQRASGGSHNKLNELLQELSTFENEQRRIDVKIEERRKETEAQFKSEKQRTLTPVEVNELAAAMGWAGRAGHEQSRTTADSISHCSTRTPTPKRWATQLYKHTFFDTVCSAAILLNAVMLGLSADSSAKSSDPDSSPQFYFVTTKVFSAWFFMELIIRVCAEGRRFFKAKMRWWNFFDTVVVTMDLIEIVLMLLASIRGNSLSSLLRAMRVLRITRAVRVFRLVRFVRELRMMVHSIICSGPSLCWSLLLFGSIAFVFGVYLMASVTAYVHESGPNAEHAAHLTKHFGSLVKTVYTLFMTVFGGISWHEISDPLLDVHWTNGLVLCFYVFFIMMAVMNIITGIFVDTAIRSAQNDHDEVIQEQLFEEQSKLSHLRRIFKDADTDGSGFITMDEFEAHLTNKEVRAHFGALDLNVDEAWGFFKLLDTDDSGAISIDEFVYGCMRMKGGATSIDIATLMHENKRMLRFWHSFVTLTHEEFDRIHEWEERLMVLLASLLEAFDGGGAGGGNGSTVHGGCLGHS